MIKIWQWEWGNSTGDEYWHQHTTADDVKTLSETQKHNDGFPFSYCGFSKCHQHVGTVEFTFPLYIIHIIVAFVIVVAVVVVVVLVLIA